MAESSSWSRASTPVAGAVFVVSATTGVLLFFHLGERLIKDLHEWVGVAFVAAAILHVLRNRHALAAHARRPTLWVALAAALVTAAAFVVPGLSAREGGGEGTRRLMQALMSAPLDEVAPILDTTPGALTHQLTSAGFTVAGASTSLREVARASGRSPQEIAAAVVAGLPPAPPR